MTDEWEASVTVTDAEQTAFVALSGDSNPLHTDPIAARRLPFGRVAVHGVHLALLSLNVLAQHDPRLPRRIRCTFRHPVGPGDPLEIRITLTSPDEALIAVDHDVWRVADIRVRLGDAAPSARSDEAIPPPGPGTPHAPEASELATLAGAIEVSADLDVVRARFPNVAAVVGDRGMAEIVSLTRLVGMHVPGLHSLFSSFDVTLGRSGPTVDQLTFAVSRYDERFSKVTIDVEASEISGSVVAFVRPPPVEPTIGSSRPPPDAFARQRWLVVGGSRGLGATAAMLLSTGGADVRITYRAGAEDAARVARAIGVSAHQLDVTDSDGGLMSVQADGWAPTHVAYFASPPIFDGAPGVYSDRLESRFQAIYIDAFETLLERLDRGQLRGVLWPSSAAVDHDVAGLAEYAVVKRRGEQRCAALDRDGLEISTPRFPRLLTDQTTSFVPVEVDDAADTVLRALVTFSG